MDSKQQVKSYQLKMNKIAMMRNQMMKMKLKNSMLINLFNGNYIEIQNIIQVFLF
jgi:hypothetical protein